MNPLRRQRLTLVLLIGTALSAAIGLALYAGSANLNLFLTPAQIAAGEAPADAVIRVGGMVVDGSVQRDPDSLEVRFLLTDYKAQVAVLYSGILPDLFREGQGIVAEGQMNPSGQFLASEVLAKHDETYMPPPVARALADAEGTESEQP